ncbi:protein transport protein sft2 [Coemansia sp. RSA 1722]|nr:protein transport protein sft2 [Coemansia sp. RSA 485]KAJ2591399.1 protein transport protein sft2 [Coemansia sp. RSA 1722]KAJ2602065.1 protein transport protein sft2 [Coemansia sp. RSA 1721]KAJ2636855.1 protein transport protein sft2 [Coemansia sp. RSA 1286]KAJ2704936.1 protein transport protein sft2 [Coemansia sp. IMI 203386]
MSSFRDALAGLKTSSSAHLLPSTPPSLSAPSSSSGGFLGSLRSGASNLASSTGSAFSSLAHGSRPAPDAPITTQGEWFGLSLMQRWIGFAGCAVLALFCFLMAFLALPLMVIKPQKFATAFSLGGLATIAGIALLRGPRAHTRHLLSRDRLLFTVTYLGSVFFTLFFSAIAHSYLGTLLFVVVQVVALVWYVVSYFPGGSAGLQSTTASLAGGARSLLPF